MKDERDPGTLDMTLSQRRRRGPKPSGKAKSAAERMREYRSRTVPVSSQVLELVGGVGMPARLKELEAENADLRSRILSLEFALLGKKHRNVTKKGKGNA